MYTCDRQQYYNKHVKKKKNKNRKNAHMKRLYIFQISVIIRKFTHTITNETLSKYKYKQENLLWISHLFAL